MWRPQTKADLVTALVSVYGKDEESKFKRMPKKQLYAIFYYLRRKYGYFS